MVAEACRIPRAAGTDALVHLEDGRSLIGPGIGIHWPEIDEDISVPRLFGLPC